MSLFMLLHLRRSWLSSTFWQWLWDPWHDMIWHEDLSQTRHLCMTRKVLTPFQDSYCGWRANSWGPEIPSAVAFRLQDPYVRLCMDLRDALHISLYYISGPETAGDNTTGYANLWKKEKTPVTARAVPWFEVYMPWAKLAIVNFVDHASCKASTLNKSKSSRCQRGLCRLHWVCVDFIRLMNTWIIWKGYISFRHVSFQTHSSCLLRLISFYSFEDPFELACLAYDFGPLVLGLLWQNTGSLLFGLDS